MHLFLNVRPWLLDSAMFDFKFRPHIENKLWGWNRTSGSRNVGSKMGTRFRSSFRLDRNWHRLKVSLVHQCVDRNFMRLSNDFDQMLISEPLYVGPGVHHASCLPSCPNSIAGSRETMWNSSGGPRFWGLESEICVQTWKHYSWHFISFSTARISTHRVRIWGQLFAASFTHRPT